MKTSLGIWAFGTMATRFVPAATSRSSGKTTPSRCAAVEGLGELIDDYEFHYPQELSRRTSTRCARHSTATASTASRAGCTSTRASARAVSLAGRGDRARRVGDARGDRLRRRARRALHHLAGDRGLQLPVPDAVPESWAWFLDGVGEAARARAGARRDDLPGAQELRAGDEDPDAEHRHDAARDPQAARAGDRQRQGQHGLAAPDHERREPRRVRGAARRGRAARAPARELRLGHVRRRQHGRRDRVHGDARARGRAAPRGLRRRTASGSASTSTRTPRTPSRAVRRSVLQWSFIDSVAARIDDGALRAAQREKDAVRAYELVYAALGA